MYHILQALTLYLLDHEIYAADRYHPSYRVGNRTIIAHEMLIKSCLHAYHSSEGCRSPSFFVSNYDHHFLETRLCLTLAIRSYTLCDEIMR